MKHSVFRPLEVDKVGPNVDANSAKLDVFAQIPTFFDRGGDALVLPRAVYDQQRGTCQTT